MRVPLFEQDLASGRLVRWFDILVGTGRHWLTRLKSRAETPTMVAFRQEVLQ